MGSARRRPTISSSHLESSSTARSAGRSTVSVIVRADLRRTGRATCVYVSTPMRDPVKMRRYRQKYARSNKGRAAMRKRSAGSASKKERQRRYNQSPKRKAALKRYHSTLKGRANLARGVHKRRAAKRIVSTLTATEWQQILTAYGHACAYCRRTDMPLTQDHVRALSKGGQHTMQNVIPACRSCNSRKGSKPITIIDMRISMPSRPQLRL